MIPKELAISTTLKAGKKILDSSTAPEIWKLIPENDKLPDQPINKSLMPVNHYYFIKVDHRYAKIKMEDIYLVEALSDYIHFHTKKKRYIIHGTLYSTLKKLPKTDFMQAHRSYIVRLENISLIENNMLLIENRRIPLGKKYKRELMARLNIFV
jgi:DNA-binding LytR/AlgR family response regulator